ncbi:DUF6456 domain-containing protein [Maricaulis sp. CAU 1757]
MAPRWLAKLARPGAFLARYGGPGEGFAVYRTPDRRRRPAKRLARRQVEQAQALGLLEAGDSGWTLSQSGRAAVEAAREEGGGLAGVERQDLQDRLLREPGRRPQRVRVAPDASPLARWQSLLDPAESEAGERFLNDYLQSSLRQSVTQNWDCPVPIGRRRARQAGGDGSSVAALAAKQRVMAVLEALPKHQASLLEAVLVREESQAAIARRLGASRRRARDAVKRAMAALVLIYAGL